MRDRSFSGLGQASEVNGSGPHRFIGHTHLDSPSRGPAALARYGPSRDRSIDAATHEITAQRPRLITGSVLREVLAISDATDDGRRQTTDPPDRAR